MSARQRVSSQVCLYLEILAQIANFDVRNFLISRYHLLSPVFTPPPLPHITW